ncbi:MAG TPA: dihydrofolate reductase [Phycisphaerales bacterium]|nr:dihydrofolate reductase [Phycisphaerales bacterium]
MRKVRYSVASSLDGFIAGPNGEHDWIIIDPSFDFAAHFANIDTVLLGRRTFEAAQRRGHGGGGMPGVRSIVCSRTLRGSDCPGVTVCDDAAAAVAGLKEQGGGDIWLMGGGGLFRSLLDAGMVDSVEVSIVPVLLGAGVPLSSGPFGAHKLELASSRVLPNGTILTAYRPVARAGGPRKRAASKASR